MCVLLMDDGISEFENFYVIDKTVNALVVLTTVIKYHIVNEVILFFLHLHHYYTNDADFISSSLSI